MMNSFYQTIPGKIAISYQQNLELWIPFFIAINFKSFVNLLGQTLFTLSMWCREDDIVEPTFFNTELLFS